ncbi:Cna B domain protein (plasmid) [Methanohalobium evestigatum Z-7303]|uniref:Cna B domain protein n=1 Tax=Methanohalobium evestigatum (strain ATCC BAA-1072 / DSM 3721 / NBRC 107634 / OCM 161 / Z-7303) TaxID=644295 RepID=D7EBW1_METEZ|nr:SdrD B-like domain-containing protein [Methanohalobium evestigatum]ADI75083.1 Cna B domain protein [Methanohalobium evestigatum Z-7303]
MMLVISGLASAVVTIECPDCSDDAQCDGSPCVRDLIAGKNHYAGEVIVWNNESHIFVKYDTNDDWCMEETQAYVGTSYMGTAPGSYDYKTTHDNCIDNFTYEIPLSDFSLDDCDTVYVATHAVVNKLNPDVPGEPQETAWGEGPEINGNWAMYFCYTIAPTASLGDYVWNDMNKNDIQDDEEVGLTGVTVNLYNCSGDSLRATTTTDENGYYNFTNLEPGNYYVNFTIPPEFEFTLQDAGPDNIDSDVNSTTGNTSCIILASGENNDTIDAGLYEIETPENKATIGDRVWEDSNGNGIQDDGELGISDIIVTLHNCSDDTIVSSTTTDADGYYNFTVTPGSYYVNFSSDGYVFTSANQGTDDGVDSDANSSGITDCVNLDNNETNYTVDAGLYRPVSIGDYVWEDVNADGIQNDGNTGIGNVTINLYDCDTGNKIANNTTDVDGDYNFTGLSPGNYYVNFEAPHGYEFTILGQGANYEDNNANILGNTTCITLVSGENNDTIDVGLYQPATIGDFVWEDSDKDGVQDPGETGISGLTVELYNCSTDELESSTITNASGYYNFSVTPGNYYVQFSSDGYNFTQANKESEDVDSDADSSGNTTCITVVSGETNETIDAGLYQQAMIGDFVWEDSDMDGIQDDGETGIPDIRVELYNCSTDNLVSNTTTNNSGYYNFTVEPGEYYVNFSSDGYEFTLQNQGGEDTVDSDANSSGVTECITLESNETNDTIDAGLYQPASIGDYVWEDVNGDGVQNDGDTGIDNVTVNLYNCNGDFLETTKTNESGYYNFTGLAPGDYYINFIDSPGYEFTILGQGASYEDNNADLLGNTTCITLVSGENNDTIDAGLYQPATIGDFVWEDTNKNGKQDIGESGISGLTVELYNCSTDDLVSNTTTNASGYYNFSVEPGEYYVNFSSDGYEFTLANQGVDNTVDSDADSSGNTTCITVESGETNDTVDAGLYQPATIGDFVWEDTNKNGKQDIGESGISGLTVELYNCSTDELESSTTTNASGYYNFSVTPGSYYVQFSSDGYEFTSSNQGTDDSMDSDADSSGNTTCITVEIRRDQRYRRCRFVPASHDRRFRLGRY